MRDFDKRFLELDNRQRSKHYFKFVLEKGLSTFYNDSTPLSILEVGCARGDFLHFVCGALPNIKATGVDIRQDLLTIAATDFPQVRFIQGDLFSLPDDIGLFDCSFMLTLHSLFDEIEPVLSAILKTVRKGGRVFLFGLFNPVELDVIIRIKKPGAGNVPETGWNIHSELTVAAFLKKHGFDFTFTRYKVEDIKLSDDDGHFSSWTQELSDGSLQLINGAQLIHPFALLEITK